MWNFYYLQYIQYTLLTDLTVSVALQPFTETWKNFAGYSLHLTSETLWKIHFSMSNHTTSEWKLNVWWIEKWWWRRSKGEGSKFSIHFCLSVCSQQLKGFEIGFFSYQFSDIGFFERRVSLHIPRLIEHEIFDGYDWRVWTSMNISLPLLELLFIIDLSFFYIYFLYNPQYLNHSWNRR